MAATRKKGKKFGSPQNLTAEGTRKAHESIKRNALEDKNSRHAYHFIKPHRESGMSYKKIAEELNAEGYVTRQGKQFYSTQVRNIYKRFADQ